MILAPLGSSRMFHPEGELAAAKAAGEAGIAYTLSTFSGYSFEELAAKSSAPLWYQLYLAGGREVVEATLARAWKNSFKALAVTIDTNGPGMRERDFRNGAPQLMGKSLFAMLPFTSQVIVRPKMDGRISDGSQRRHPLRRTSSSPAKVRCPRPTCRIPCAIP